MKEEDAAHADRIRKQLADEIPRADQLLADISDPWLKGRVELHRHDLDEVESIYLKLLPSSETPKVVLHLAALQMAGLVKMRQEYEQLLKEYGPDLKTVG